MARRIRSNKVGEKKTRYVLIAGHDKILSVNAVSKAQALRKVKEKLYKNWMKEEKTRANSRNKQQMMTHIHKQLTSSLTDFEIVPYKEVNWDEVY